MNNPLPHNASAMRRAGLDDEQLDSFRREGYLVVEGLLDPARDIDPLIAEYEGVLDSLAHELHGKGEISSTFPDLPFGRRLIEIYKETGKVHTQYFDFTLGNNVTGDTKFWVGPAVFSILRNERLLDAIESIIGPEIYSNPVQHVRLKPPEKYLPRDAEGRVQGYIGATPPHQDHGVVTKEADDTEIITAWFPLWDTTVENGCMLVWPRSKESGLAEHCLRFSGLQIPDSLLPGKPRALPMKRGDVLLMNKLTMHGSLSNHSDEIRFSMDLRYNPIGQPTGRDFLPGFVARSRSHRETELRSPVEWARLWHDCRSRLAGQPPLDHSQFHRWSANGPACA